MALDHHSVVFGVAAIAVGVPVLLPQVQFHVASDQANALHLQQSIPKIWAGGNPGPARVDHPHPPAGFSAQRHLPYGPFFPELGQQPLRYLFFFRISPRGIFPQVFGDLPLQRRGRADRTHGHCVSSFLNLLPIR